MQHGDYTGQVIKICECKIAIAIIFVSIDFTPDRRQSKTLILSTNVDLKSLDDDSATIRNFGQNDTNHNRNGKSTVEAQ